MSRFPPIWVQPRAADCAGWEVRVQGRTRAHRWFETRPEAIELGRSLALKYQTELVILEEGGCRGVVDRFDPEPAGG